MGPLFSYRLFLDQIQKKAIVYTIFPGKRGKRVYTIGPERRVYTIEASDPEIEKKEGLHGGGAYFFFPVFSFRPFASYGAMLAAVSLLPELCFRHQVDGVGREWSRAVNQAPYNPVKTQ